MFVVIYNIKKSFKKVIQIIQIIQMIKYSKEYLLSIIFKKRRKNTYYNMSRKIKLTIKLNNKVNKLTIIQIFLIIK